MNKLFTFLSLFILLATNASAQGQIQVYPNCPPTQYVLPGELWWIQYGIEGTVPIIYTKADLYYMYVQENSLPGTFMQSHMLHSPDSTTTTIVSDKYGWLKMMWYVNYSSAARNFLWLCYLNAQMNLQIGMSIPVYFAGEAGDAGLSPSYFNNSVDLVGIDGIRGDVNGNGMVDTADVRLLREYLTSGNAYASYFGRYTNTGINFGRGRVLFHIPDLLSLTLINIYVHDPYDPLVQGLGIGEPYSTPNQIQPVPLSNQVSNGSVIIQTEGQAAIVSGFLDGKLWHKSAYINQNGIIDFPEGLEMMSVQAVSVPGSVTAVTDLDNRPAKFELSQNYPNPFNPTTSIRFKLPEASQVSIKIYDLIGNEVAVLVNGPMAAGEHQADFDGSDLASGMYICRIISGNFVKSIKMTLMK